MLKEISNIASDILSGALPASEIPGFLAFLFRQIAKISLLIIFAFAIATIIAR